MPNFNKAYCTPRDRSNAPCPLDFSESAQWPIESQMGKMIISGKKRAQVESPNFTTKTKKVNQVPNIYIFCYQVSKNEKAKCYKKETTLCFFVVIRGLTATKASLASEAENLFDKSILGVQWRIFITFSSAFAPSPIRVCSFHTVVRAKKSVNGLKE